MTFTDDRPRSRLQASLRVARGAATDVPLEASSSDRMTTRLQGFAPRRSPCSRCCGLGSRGAVALMGFMPLQGIAPAGPGAAVSSFPPPMDFLSPALQHVRVAREAGTGEWPFGVSLSPVADAPVLTDPSTLLRFLNLISFSRVWRPSSPGSFLRLGFRATSPCPAEPSSRWSEAPTGVP